MIKHIMALSRPKARRKLKLKPAGPLGIFWGCLILGLIVRLVCAHVVYGPQSLDDYRHGIWPAQQLLEGIDPNLPDYRSYLLVWILSGFMWLGKLFGASTSLDYVRWAYSGLGLVSLSLIPALHLYFKDADKKVYRVALLIGAIFPLFVFVGTRAFGEAVALPLVVLGFAGIRQGLIDKKKANLLVFGLFMLGLATFFRFHVGLMYLVVIGFLILQKNRRPLYLSLATGFFLVALQSYVDVLSGRPAFSTLLSYLSINEGGATGYGVSPWYNTVLLVLGLCLFPFTIPYFKKYKSLWKSNGLEITAVGLFALAHVLVPHKEERFLFPIVGLIFVLMYKLYVESQSKVKAKNHYSQFFFAPFFIGLTLLGLTVVTTNNTLVGEIEPAATLTKRHAQVLFVEVDSLLGRSFFRDFFVRLPHRLISPIDLKPATVDALLFKESDRNEDVVAIVTSNPDFKTDIQNLRDHLSAGKFACSDLKTASSWLDEWIYKRNPKNNKRRRPTWYFTCEASISG